MREAVMGLFGRSEASEKSEGLYDLRAAMRAAADKTQPGSNVRKLPLDATANLARAGTQKVVAAQAKLHKLQDAHKQACEELDAYTTTFHSEWAARITTAEIDLDKVERERRENQYRIIRELVDTGVVEGVKSLDELLRSKEFHVQDTEGQS